MANGFIKIDRKILDNPFWHEKPFDFAHAWIDLLLLASWKDHKTISHGQVIEWKRGEVKTSYLKLAERWGWSVNKVRRIIRQTNELAMTTTHSTANGTTIYIENYTFYQDRWSTHGTTDGTTDGTTHGIHQNNYKEIKENNTKRAKARRGGNSFLSLLESGALDE